MTAAALAQALFDAICRDPEDSIPAAILLRECERAGIILEGVDCG